MHSMAFHFLITKELVKDQTNHLIFPEQTWITTNNHSFKTIIAPYNNMKVNLLNFKLILISFDHKILKLKFNLAIIKYISNL